MPTADPPHPAAGRTLGVVATAALILAACTSEDVPEPAPPVSYERVTTDVCDQLSIERTVTAHDLELRSVTPRDIVEELDLDAGLTTADCRVGTRDPEWSLDNKFGFQPSFSIRFATHETVQGAIDDYERQAGGNAELPVAERIPGVIGDVAQDIRPIDGWWDQGTVASMSWRRYAEPTRGDMRLFTPLHVRYFVQHENLYLALFLDGGCLLEDADRSRAVAHEISTALLDEVADHVTPTTPTPPS